MEFHVVAKREIGGEAKLSFNVFTVAASLGGNAKGADERTQKVKFALNPVLVDAEGKPSKLSIARQNTSNDRGGGAPKRTLERD